MLAARGATVLAHGRDKAALESVPGATPIVEDLAEPGAGARLAAQAGRVAILVANAGTGFAGRLSTMEDEAIGALVAANLTAPIQLTRALLPDMLDRGQGVLAYVTSIAGRLGVADEAVYAATKAGLDAFAESLRFELRGTGVTVGVLVPGVVATPFFERRGRPYDRSSPRPMPVEPVAAALVRLVETGAAEAYRPRWLRFPVAMRAVAPSLYRGLAGRFGGS
jgi:short-subunit dehydrogenase